MNMSTTSSLRGNYPLQNQVLLRLTELADEVISSSSPDDRVNRFFILKNVFFTYFRFSFNEVGVMRMLTIRQPDSAREAFEGLILRYFDIIEASDDE